VPSWLGASLAMFDPVGRYTFANFFENTKKDERNVAAMGKALEGTHKPLLSARLVAECRIWKQDRSEGASTYFLDPDGHKLEIHVGSLQSRLQHYRETPSKGVHVVDN
jgi:hypothetical protein